MRLSYICINVDQSMNINVCFIELKCFRGIVMTCKSFLPKVSEMLSRLGWKNIIGDT